MTYIQKVIRKIKGGALRDIARETRWIYRYARQYRWQIGLYILLGLTATAVSLISGLVSRRVVNLVVTGAGDSAALRAAVPVMVLFVALALGKIALSAVSGRVTAKINLRVNLEMRGDIYRKFMNTSWEAISDYHSGDLLNRIHSDVSAVAGSVLGWIPSLINSLVQLMGALAIIVYYDPVMGLLALCSVPVTSVVFGLLAPRLHRYNRQVADMSGELTAFYSDSLQNIQSVKSFGAVDAFCRKLRSLQDRHYELSLTQNRFTIFASSCMSLLGLIASYLCMGWGVYRLWTGKIDYGTMVLFLQMAGYVSSAAGSLLRLGPSVIGATVSAQRIMNILDLPRENVEPDPMEEPLRRDPEGVSVRLEGVSFAYRPEAPVLEKISFSAEPGQVVAVVGPSGAGKTTLLRLLLCLLQPKEGRAVLSGREAGEAPLSPGLRQLFSYVPQDRALYSGTIAQTLRLAKPQASDEELWAALRLAELEDVVRVLPQGLDTPIGEEGSKFSAGQGQRLSVARAILHDAPILLLDEATSALDVATERRILRNIMGHCAHKTCIVTTHRPSVLTMCDRVYRIDGGEMTRLDEAGIEALRREF